MGASAPRSSVVFVTSSPEPSSLPSSRPEAETAPPRTGVPAPEGGAAPGVLLGRWAGMIGLSAVISTLLTLGGLPAALLLGPMLAAMAMALSGRSVAIPRWGHMMALGVVGAMVGSKIPLTILSDLADHWLAFGLGVASVLVLAGGLGWLLARARVLPGTTAVWGAWPGAASAMVLLSDSYGADMRLVAVMQYLRVALVASSAALIAHFWVGVGDHSPEPTVWFPALDPGGLAITGAVVAISLFFGRVVKMPSALFLAPMGLAIALSATGLPTPALPQWLLAAAYTVAGWSIGLRFTRPILSHAARALPRLFLGILALIALCFALGAALAAATGETLLTAVLATSPGGMDSVAIIAAGADVNLPFVMAMQAARFMAVLVFGPYLARMIAGLVDRA